MTNVAVLSLEVLVAGITAMVWIVLIIIRVLYPDNQIETELLAVINSISAGNLLITSILIYNIGWVIHHIGERLFDPIFQTKYRRKMFEDEEFYKIRTKIFQEGSSGTLDDIKFDRHILRISRSNILNFTVLAIVSLFYLRVNPQVFTIVFLGSLLVAFVSFLQWYSRYQGTFKKFRDIYNAITEKEAGANGNTIKIEVGNLICGDNGPETEKNKGGTAGGKKNKKGSNK